MARTRLHTLLPEAFLARLLDLLHTIHCAHRRFHELAVVLHRPMSQPLEVEGCIHTHFLPGSLPVSFGPLELARIELRAESFVALGATEAKFLGVVTHECDTFARVHRPGADLPPCAHGIREKKNT